MNKNRWAAAIVPVALLTGMVQVMAQVPVAAAAPATKINLATVEQSVTDPLKNVQPVDRNCRPSQVDVNTASLDQIAAAISVPSDPTLQRIIDLRPWTDATHLVSVPGIGPAKLSTLQTMLCATPTQLPPTVTQAPPSGFSGIDIQFAGAKTLSKLLPGPVATRLAAIPVVPDNLFQLLTPAVEGLDATMIQSLLDNPDVAITPMPFTYGGSSYRWATHDRGAVVAAAEDPRYALVVPPGKVIGDGAWAQTTVLPLDFGSFPAADFHIFGAWEPEVAVRLPDLSDLNIPQRDYVVWHDAETGPRLSVAPNLAFSGGTVTAAARSLSTEVVATLGFCDQPMMSDPSRTLANTNAVLCNLGVSNIGDVRDSDLSGILTQAANKEATYADTLQKTGNDCVGANNPLIISSGQLWDMDCIGVTQDGDRATFTYRNNGPDSPANLAYMGVAYDVTSTQAKTANATYTDGKFLTGAVFSAISDRIHDVPPGSEVSFFATQGAGPNQIQVKASGGTWAYWLFSQITLPLDVYSTFFTPDNKVGYSKSFKADLAACIGQVLINVGTRIDVDSFKTAFECATTFVSKAIIDRSYAPYMNGTTKEAKNFRGMTEAITKINWAIKAIDLVATGIQWAYQHENPGNAEVEFLAPAPPLPVGVGGSSAASDGSYIARESDGSSYFVTTRNPPLVDIGTAAWPIQSSQQFNCFAASYFVIDQVKKVNSSDGTQRLLLNNSLLDIKSKDAPNPPTCTTGALTTWTYTPNSNINVSGDFDNPIYGTGNVPPGVIVKMPDWEGKGSWYIAPNGQIISITSGVDYICMTRGMVPVIFNFPMSKVNAWRPIGYDMTVTCTSSGIIVLPKF